MHFVTQEEFRHWFTPREGIVDSFVVKVRILFSAAFIKKQVNMAQYFLKIRETEAQGAAL